MSSSNMATREIEKVSGKNMAHTDPMNVERVIALAKQWVDTQGSRMPGFNGAHLAGGILSLPRQDPFPPYLDVDVRLLLADLPAEGTPEAEGRDLAYQGLILECGAAGVARYRSPEAVLADPDLAGNLVVDGILADPLGLLRPLHERVACDYGRREWVRARCVPMKAAVDRMLEAVARAAQPDYQATRSDEQPLWLLPSTALALSGLLAVSRLERPTYRRSLVLLRHGLAAEGRLDLHEEALRLLGYDRLDRSQVEAYLAACAVAFDLAVAVKDRWVPFDFKLQAHVRPYIVAGAREMIDEGQHREAMFWIASFLIIAHTAIQWCAPQQAGTSQAAVDTLTADVGLTDPDALHARGPRLRALAAAVIALADGAVDRLPA